MPPFTSLAAAATTASVVGVQNLPQLVARQMDQLPPPDPLPPLIDMCNSQSGITVWTRGMCVLGWAIDSEADMAGICAIIVTLSFLIEFITFLAAKYERVLKRRRQGLSSRGSRPTLGEASLRTLIGLVRFGAVGFTIMCGLWSNVTWIISTIIGYTLGSYLTNYLTPVEGAADVGKLGDIRPDRPSSSSWRQRIPAPPPQQIPQYNRRVRSDPPQQMPGRPPRAALFRGSDPGPPRRSGRRSAPGSWF
ncbi:uncharacterized protein B0I36DRAFT_360091 [Microdochium trichocladiopsis]|uniref:Copper transport protein n=1 Tax=Microdochium trichocladiopsis TaxID=1682393 RepID=A0A9P8Y9W1_9PEZI|nr:uncharacterized protein B0I36DRAFT_360091 [Microdochium trichocladiopsis]KAH7034583.1 hypothetical protein B0I36DRAFT_360091 [Microdochium trichocladiopsis]